VIVGADVEAEVDFFVDEYHEILHFFGFFSFVVVFVFVE
jgi:hypothetical protein